MGCGALLRLAPSKLFVRVHCADKDMGCYQHYSHTLRGPLQGSNKKGIVGLYIYIYTDNVFMRPLRVVPMIIMHSLGTELQIGPPNLWLAVKDKLSYYNKETLLSTIYSFFGNGSPKHYLPRPWQLNLSQTLPPQPKFWVAVNDRDPGFGLRWRCLIHWHQAEVSRCIPIIPP